MVATWEEQNKTEDKKMTIKGVCVCVCVGGGGGYTENIRGSPRLIRFEREDVLWVPPVSRLKKKYAAAQCRSLSLSHF